MRFPQRILPALLLVGAAAVEAASEWSFDEAIISITGKGPDGGLKDKLDQYAPLSKPITLGASDNLKIIVTATEDRKAKRPHQAFLLIREMDTGLETSFPFSVKNGGKGKVELAQKDLPAQLLTSTQPLRATLLLAGFGPSKGFSNHVFNLNINPDAATTPKQIETPLRYGKLPEIHHIFRSDPTSPPIIITLAFTIGVLGTVPVLFIAWLSLGANANHLTSAISSAPVAHVLFFGSVIVLEGIFFLYYTHWNLFQTLPAAGVIGTITFLSGSRVLREVQERRLAGKR